MPLGVFVRGDVALGADAGIVHEQVEPTEVLGDLGDARAHTVVVGDVDGDREIGVLGAIGAQIEHGDLGAVGAQALGDGRADAAGAAGDDGDEPLERSGR
ncbi:hypothetical protein Agsp01_19170 [Agromyces sp. NBRC 114283]|nr:hypothetical protein Agsp01_19170 [Agromyces sp. NBRC 114283]